MPKVLSTAEIDRALADRGLGWQHRGDELVKSTEHRDFVGSLAYVNRVGELAEAAGHHPDVDIRWATVVLRLSTHSEGGITTLDLDLAAAIDLLDAG